MLFPWFIGLYQYLPGISSKSASHSTEHELLFGSVMIVSCIYWGWKGTKQYDGPSVVIQTTVFK